MIVTVTPVYLDWINSVRDIATRARFRFGSIDWFMEIRETTRRSLTEFAN